MSSSIKPVLGSQLELGHTLSNGLVGFWLLNEGSGETVQDLSGNSHNGSTSFGSPTWVAGDRGHILDFDGTDDVLGLGIQNAGMYGNHERTIIFRARFDSFDIGTNETILDANGDVGTAGKFFNINLEDNGISLVFNSHRVIFDKGVLSTGVYYTVAVVVPAGSTLTSDVICYIDGVLATPTTEAGSAQTLDTNVGNWALGGSSLSGASTGDFQIDWLYAYECALLSSEIALLGREPFIMFDRDPIELWVGSVGVAVGGTILPQITSAYMRI